MNTLNISEAEAQEIIGADKAIDRNERVSFDLPAEQEKQAKKYVNSDTHKRPKNPVHRERKPDEQKEALIEQLTAFMRQNAQNVIIANKNRQVNFSIGEDTYYILLVKNNKKGK